MDKRLIAGVLALVCGCVRSPFVEPPWGAAPTALPGEITEITLHRWECDPQDRCVRDSVTLRRDGYASRVRMGKGQETRETRTTISPDRFRSIAARLINLGMFQRQGDDAPEMMVAMRSVVISAASLCRRKVVATSGQHADGLIEKLTAYLDSVVASLNWPPTRQLFPQA